MKRREREGGANDGAASSTDDRSSASAIGSSTKRKAVAPPVPSGPKTPHKGLPSGGAELPGGGVELQYEPEPPRGLEPRPVPLRHSRNAGVPAVDEPLCFMTLDIQDEGQGRFNAWGMTAAGASVLLCLHGFHPYFHIAAPRRQVEGVRADEEIEWHADELQRLQRLLNLYVPPSARIVGVQAVQRASIMYFRPDQPQGGTFLKLSLAPGGNTKAAADAVGHAMAGGLRGEGLVWRDLDLYEPDIKPLQRLLVDTPLNGGAWLYLPPAAAAGTRAGAGWQPVPEPERVSTCTLEAAAPWHAVCCLSPDATQLTDPAWSPFACGGSNGGGGGAQVAAGDPVVQAAAEAARRGDIAPLRVLVMDVLSATRDGADRAVVASQGDPCIAISCTLCTFSAQGHQGEVSAAAAPDAAGPSAAAAAATAPEDSDGPGAEAAEEGEEEEQGEAVLTAAAVAGAPTGAGPRRGPAAAAAEAGRETFVFLLHPAAARQRGEAIERSCGPPGAPAQVLLFGSEAEMLVSWAQFVHSSDPDVVGLFQVNDTMAVLQQRYEALGLAAGGGRGLRLSRLLPRAARPVSIHKVTNYSAQWAREKQRLSAGSNQETWRVQEIDGRLVFDVVRQAVAQGQLASFSFADCVQSLLGEMLEVLRPNRLAGLAGLAGPPQQPLLHARLAAGAAAEADAMRLARYALRRCAAVDALMHRLATVPDAVEMARACGLTLTGAQYTGAMARVHSLLLRAARRRAFLLPHQSSKFELGETTFIQHPVESGTTGLYKEPVVLLDFASMYPSLYRAHNLCYSTLLHDAADAARLPPGAVARAPRSLTDAAGRKSWGEGSAFVKPDVRQGVLPGILAALTAARAATRAQLKGATDPATRAVLDCRQKALKVTANAVYGFTGTNVSPLQCVEVGDACLAYGRQGCEHAKHLLEAAAAEGRLGPLGRGAQVIYGHTDSLFAKLPQCPDARAAISVGKAAAALVSDAFAPPIRMEFERVCQPFLLLHANRYAGRAFQREEDVVEGGGELICKGIRSMWRQSAPVLRTTLHGALERILVRDDIRGAVAYVCGEVRRLMEGRAELSELIMTGGLWRVTGEQVERAAAGPSKSPGRGGGRGGRGGGSGGGRGGGSRDEEIRQPHNALAVRLKQRDPGFSTVLGQRLPYVLLAGRGKQDESSEDPLTAAKEGGAPDVRLYWENKMRTPICEVFEAALPPALHASLLQEIRSGDHTRIKVDSLSAPPPVLGPASPPPAGPRGRAPAALPSGSPGPRKQQPGMAAFYRQLPKCLGCGCAMKGHQGDVEDAPGLCGSCQRTEGKWAETYLRLGEEQRGAQARQAAALAACAGCRSGGGCGPVLCENGECPVTYTRLACSSRLQQVEGQLARMDISG